MKSLNIFRTGYSESNRLERSAHPSSNISSTISGSIYSLSAWGDESDDFFLQNIFLKTPIPGCFLGSGMEELFFSAIISTTIQVVSSRSPFDCTAVLTICSAAGSGGSSREQLKATSGDKTSQTPSLAIISRPPAVDSFTCFTRGTGTINWPTS